MITPLVDRRRPSMTRPLLALSLALCVLPRPAALAAQGTDRELACRGGPGISFETELNPIPRDTTRAILIMRYRASTTVMNDRDYKNLEPGTCTWNSYRNPRVPPEPGRARVELLRDAQPSAASRRIDTSITAAARFKDVSTVPRYLTDPRLYYSFYIDDKSLLSTVHGALYDTTSGSFALFAGPSMLPPGTKRDIRCRGGVSGLLWAGGGSVGTNLASVTLNYRVSASVPGTSGMALAAGSCAWVDRTGVPKEPRTVTFTTASNAQLKQAQSGSGIDRSATAAERWPDVRSIPEYLKDPLHFWRFTVTVDQPSKAFTHGAWKVDPTDIVATSRSTSTPTTRSAPAAGSIGDQPYTPGRTGTSSVATTVFDIKNVSATPGLEGVAIRFDAAPNIRPVVTVTPDNGGAPIQLAVGGAPNGTMWRYSAASTTKLARNTRYTYRIDAPAAENARANSRSGSFKTLGQRVNVVFSQIYLISDGDTDASEDGGPTGSDGGDLNFDFGACPVSTLTRARVPAVTPSGGRPDVQWSDGAHAVNVQIASTSEATPDRIRILVIGFDADQYGASYARTPDLGCTAASDLPPGRTPYQEWNSIVREIDLSAYPGVKAGDQFAWRSKPLANGSKLMFEVRGSFLITRQ